MIKMAPKEINISSSLNCLFSDEEIDSIDESLSQNDSPVKCPPISELTEIDENQEGNYHEEFQIKRINTRHKNTVQLSQDIFQVNQTIEENATRVYTKEFIKEMISKQKKRFQLDGFNLDLTYVTPQIIAMGYPAENYESIYRNSLSEVQKFLNTRHPQKYKVFNLCSERQYAHNLFYKVVEFPFEDHQPPPFQMILPFCLTMEKWLKKPNRVAAVHCKAGKGRTGTMIACYLLYSKQYQSSKDALKYYAMIRTQNEQGVTIPSQARYVEYFNIGLQKNLLTFPPRSVELITIKLHGLPNFGIFGGCKPYVRIQNENQQLIQEPIQLTNQEQNQINEYCAIFTFQGVFLTGDVLIQFFHKSIVLESKMFQAWFNTSFVALNPQVQIYKRNELDEVVKDKHFKKFPQNFQLEIEFDKIISIRRRSNCIK